MHSMYLPRKTVDRSDYTIGCFTPLATLITFIVEILMAIWVFWKHRLSPLWQIAVLFLISLAMFQIAEYMICGTWATGTFWLRVWFAFTSLLPAIGYHLVCKINELPRQRWIRLFYGISGVLFVSFFVAPDPYFWYHCTGNFVRFSGDSLFHDIYLVYYIIVIAWSLLLLIRQLRSADALLLRRANWWCLAAYLSFLITTAVLLILGEITTNDIWSVLCGFAILAGIAVTFGVLPAYNRAQQIMKNKTVDYDNFH